MREEDKRSSNEQPLKDIIDKFLKAYSLEHKMKEYDVIQNWPILMGKAVALRTKEITISNKRMRLVIDSSVMREELLFGKQLIIDRVNDYAGFEIINDIWFV
jgi:hypothetical protein